MICKECPLFEQFAGTRGWCPVLKTVFGNRAKCRVEWWIEKRNAMMAARKYECHAIPDEICKCYYNGKLDERGIDNPACDFLESGAGPWACPNAKRISAKETEDENRKMEV